MFARNVSGTKGVAGQAIAPKNNLATWVLASAGTLLAISLSFGLRPGLYEFFAVSDLYDQSSDFIPVHLWDDVMIIFRSAQILLLTGTPSFNLSDLAQPSTSYLLPYIIAGSLFITPNMAWGAFTYSALSLGALLATVGVIVRTASNQPLAFLLVVLLSLTSTNLLFSLSGWDHIWQGFFFALTLLFIFKSGQNVSSNVTGNSIAVGVLAALGVLARPDGGLVGLGLAFSALLALRAAGHSVAKTLLPLASFSLVGILALTINLSQFGWVLPTTVRLKSGASGSVAQAWDYFFANSVLSFSVITLFLVLAPLVTFLPSWSKAIFWPLLLGILGSAVIAFINSDVFDGGRMYWGPTIALSLVILSCISMGPRDLRRIMKGRRRFIPATVIGVFVIGSLGLALFAIPLRQEGTGTINSENISDTTKPKLFLKAKWIERNLSASDGAVGTFYAGVAAHMPESFDVADLLGKGDELIARSPHKHGTPGHTKWDFEATIQKWNPQVILLTDDRNPNEANVIDEAQLIVANKEPYSFTSELLIDPTVRQEFLWCQIHFELHDGASFSSPVLLRKNLGHIESSRPDLTCLVLVPIVDQP